MDDWEKILVRPDSTLRDALEVINENSSRVVYVVDDQKTLQGVVTDGDIRRGLLDNVSLESEIADVMNQEAVIASKLTTRSERVALMERESILSVPIVDDRVIVGIEMLQELDSSQKYDNPVFIMAGGFGTRLRPMTDNCPKPMLKVGGRPLLETLLLNFIEAGFVNFYISTHYLPEVIQEYFGSGYDWGIKITYVHEEIPLGTGGALGMLPDDISKLPMILMNGDVLTKVDFQSLLQSHEESNAVATICTRQYEYQIPYGVIESNSGRITKMVEKPTYQYFINAGIYVLNQEVIAGVDSNQRIDLPSYLDEYLAKGCHVAMYPLHEYWLDIGRLEDFERAQKDILLL